MTKPIYAPYTVKGHMAHSGYKFSIKHCYPIDDIWYRPVVADYSGNSKTYRQPEDNEIGWDYIPFADDAVIDSWEREEYVEKGRLNDSKVQV